MRLWSIHPKYLDSKGLVALWREGLLAQKALRGKTTGYRNHPQLVRFKNVPHPLDQLNSYLACVYQEACARGFKFDGSKIGPQSKAKEIAVTSGQLLYEKKHLKNKLKLRAPEMLKQLINDKTPEPNPVFKLTPGLVEDWEKINTV